MSARAHIVTGLQLRMTFLLVQELQAYGLQDLIDWSVQPQGHAVIAVQLAS